MSDETRSTILESIYKEVRTYARIEFARRTRKVIHRMQRVKASGIFGDSYIYKTLWDEYCHEVQEGPHDPLERAWDLTIPPFIDEVIEHLPRHVAVLLSIFAAWDLDEDDNPNIVGAFWPDGIHQVLRSLLNEQAGNRRLHHLGPYRNY
jgi:hypothetical protein